MASKKLSIKFQKPKLTPAREQALKEYNRQRNRIRNTVRRAEQRGYRFPVDVVPPTVTQLGSIKTVSLKAQARKLAEIKPSRLYAQATAISDKTGERIAGTQRRAEERHEAGILASINRKANAEERKEKAFIADIQEAHDKGITYEELQQEREEAKKQKEYWEKRERELAKQLDESVEAEQSETLEEIQQEEKEAYEEFEKESPQRSTKPSADTGGYTPELSEDEIQEAIDEEERQWQEQQRAKDSANIQKLQSDQKFAQQFKQGEVIYQNIQQMINDALGSGTFKQAGFDLMSELNEQISTYGKDKVMGALGSAPADAIEAAQVALQYNPGDNRHDSAILALRTLIVGEIPSAQEVKDLEDSIEADAYTNDDF